jgi:hypothetical protein
MAKKTDWKLLFEKDDELQKSGRENLYERAKLLETVFDKTDFQKEEPNARQVLNDRLSATGFTFDELYQMVKMFPEKRQWRDTNLAAMRLDMLRSITPKAKKQKGKKITRNVVTRTEYEYEAVAQDADALRTDVAHWKEKYELLLQQRAVLEDQIKELKERIQEQNKLIRLLQRDEDDQPAPSLLKKKKARA